MIVENYPDADLRWERVVEMGNMERTLKELLAFGFWFVYDKHVLHRPYTYARFYREALQG